MLKIQQLFSFRLFVCFLCFTGVIFGGVMTFFFQDMFNAILAQVSHILPYTSKRESNQRDRAKKYLLIFQSIFRKWLWLRELLLIKNGSKWRNQQPSNSTCSMSWTPMKLSTTKPSLTSKKWDLTFSSEFGVKYFSKITMRCNGSNLKVKKGIAS